MVGTTPNMMSTPEDPINDPTEFSDSGPAIDAYTEDHAPSRNPFQAGGNPRYDPQTQPSS